jgi:murein DD-endopeptidase MepM/ murein hydrolase activator NlpD
MMHRVLVTGMLGVLAGPAVVIATVALLASAALLPSCSPTAVGRVPDELRVTGADGSPVRLDRTQLRHAATIIAVGQGIDGVGRDGLIVALMAGLTESGLRMYANTTAYPESAGFSHDADGSDHDSLGIFQMRPAAGWGSVAELMDPIYQARAYFGGPSGPNAGSPRGLLDIPAWHTLSKGAAAQAVEVSAYPDRYARYEPVAEAILAALTDPAPSASPAPVAEAEQVVFPLPDGTWTPTSGFGMRRDPVLGVWRLHAGVDLAAAAGFPVLATADGRVVEADATAGLGNRIVLEHTVDGRPVVSVYGHLLDDGVHVAAGDLVMAGQHIGDVGSTGNSTGPHLHFELRPGGPNAAAVDPQPWLDVAIHLAEAEQRSAAPSCPAVSPSGVRP